MLKHVTLAMDATDPATWERAEVEDLSAYLASRFDHLPSNARIYHEYVADSHDVTPSDEAGIARLAEMSGPFFVVVFPGDPVTLGQVFLVFFSAAVSMSMAPNAPPSVAQRNQSIASPNNELSDRVNRARINGRIPDIYGTVRSTPDLISAPYKVFENGKEVEYVLLCIGRGQFDIDDVRDGDTLCSNIPGTTVQVYAPYTSPNSGDAPQLVIGQPRSIPVLNTRRSNSVNGQVLRPPNVSEYVAAGNVRFVAPNIIELVPNTAADFTKFFVEGDLLTLANASMTAAGGAPTQQITCRASRGTSLFLTRVGSEHYPTENSLVFDMSETGSVALDLFSAGLTITLSTVSGPYNLDGTYTIDSVQVFEPNQMATNGGIPKIFIVTLVDPASVNANWNSLPGDDTAFHKLKVYSFDLTLDAVVAYDINLDDTGYLVLSVTKETIVLDDPVSINADWAVITTNGGVTPYMSPTITASADGKWVGPFILREGFTNSIFANFVASNGLYKDDGTDQFAEQVTVEVEVTPVDGDDLPLDVPEIYQITLDGSATLKETVAITMKRRFSAFLGRVSVRARRVTEHDATFTGTVVDEVRWRDLYSVTDVPQNDFGNVTIIQACVFATASALAIKERKLTLLASRKLPVYSPSNGTFDDVNLVATDNAADVLVSICRDRYIGNRRFEEIDVPNFYDTVEAVQAYFGHENAGKFSYTFDQDTVSFEESAVLVAKAIFCEAYRRGSVIRLTFERQTDNSTLLFNHRNKVPGTERRTVSFGYNNDNDGIEYVYVNPDDDSIISVFLPNSHAAINPKLVESIGVRNHLQAYFHAWRAWNKLQYQYLAVEFEATSESELVLKNDRILVADNTRPGTQDGEVRSVNTLELTLSQAVDLTEFATYVIHLQHVDGTVESIGITAGTDPNQVVLDDAPAMPLATDPEGFVRTGYVIVGDEDPRVTAFLVTERETLSRMTSRVQAVNYDDRYYLNDPDFINEVIGENGYGPEGGFTPDAGTEWNPGGAPVVPLKFVFTAGFSPPNGGYNTSPAQGTFVSNDSPYTYTRAITHASYGDLTINSPELYAAMLGSPTLKLRCVGYNCDLTLYQADLDLSGSGELYKASSGGYFEDGNNYEIWTE